MASSRGKSSPLIEFENSPRCGLDVLVDLVELFTQKRLGRGVRGESFKGGSDFEALLLKTGYICAQLRLLIRGRHRTKLSAVVFVQLLGYRMIEVGARNIGVAKIEILGNITVGVIERFVGHATTVLGR